MTQKGKYHKNYQRLDWKTVLLKFFDLLIALCNSISINFTFNFYNEKGYPKLDTDINMSQNKKKVITSKNKN